MTLHRQGYVTEKTEITVSTVGRSKQFKKPGPSLCSRDTGVHDDNVGWGVGSGGILVRGGWVEETPTLSPYGSSLAEGG